MIYMNNLPKDLKVHVVSHTHWDREWRQPLEFFQPYLVKCLDQLLKIFKKKPDYKAFLLDGQSIMVEDYLELRPERENEIRDRLKSRRLFTGPWYSLIDNNLIDGESIIRNLLYGTRLAQKYGSCMKEGYLISSFGHCGQIPQIFAGFGVSSILFSRGISEWQAKSELIWEAPDGTQALGLHLPDRYTKSNWFYLVHRPGCVGRDAMDWKYRWPSDEPMHACDSESSNHYWWRTREVFLKDKDFWIQCVNRLIEKCLSVSAIPILLAMDGVDHLFPHEDVPDIIKTANEYFGSELLIHSSFPSYVADVRKYLKKNNIELQNWKGEMRRPMKVPGFNQLLAGTISARMNMKLLNHAAETALIRLSEPLCSLNFIHGSEYPKSALEKAWKLIMPNHAHDGICGTSADAVHEAMADRYKRAANLADFLAYESMKELVLRVDTTNLKERELALTVFNTTGFSRTRVVRAVVDIPYEWNAAGVEICDLKGNSVPFLLKTKQKQEREILADHEAQLGFLCLRLDLEFLAKNLPAFGYKTFLVRPAAWHQKGKSNDPSSASSTAPLQIENEFLKIKAEPDGTLSLTDKKSGQIFSGLNLFASSGDIGDSTWFIPPMSDFTVYSSQCRGSVELVDEGPLSASLRITRRMILPAYCEPKAKFVELVETAQPFKAHRSKDTVEEIVTSLVTLEYGSPSVNIRTTVENKAKDHRLRVLFPSGACNAKTWITDAPFEVVERDIALPDTREWAEPWPETQPVRTFFAVCDGQRGLAVFTRGIPEAACIDDKERTLALTLLRCTRRSIGEDYSQEGPQCLGTHHFEYSLQPVSGDWKSLGLPQAASDFTTPIRAILSASGRKGALPPEAEYLSFTVKPKKASGNLVVSAIKKAEDSKGLIIRLFNPTDLNLRVEIRTSKGLGIPKPVNSDETRLKNAGKSDSDHSIDIGPYKICSLFFPVQKI
jgi:mannosylglycerate hydrolase